MYITTVVMDIVKSIGELLHENALEDLESDDFKGASKELCKIRLTFECQRCFVGLPCWKQFVDHINDHANISRDLWEDTGLESNESLNEISTAGKPSFPLPPKKNKLARTEANDESLESRRSKGRQQDETNRREEENKPELERDNDQKFAVKRKRGRPPKRKLNEDILRHAVDVSQIVDTAQDTVHTNTRQSKRLNANAPDYTDSTVQSADLDITDESQNQNEKSGMSESLGNLIGEKSLSEAQENESHLLELESKEAECDESEFIVSNEVVTSPETQETGPFNIEPNSSHVDVTSEEAENSDKLLKLGSSENNEAAIADILNIKHEEYAVMSRDQKEDLKARTCPFCFDTLPTLSDCLPHYKQQHDFTPKSCNNIDDQKFKPNSGGRGIKAADTCEQCQFCGKYFLKDKIDRHVILVHVWRSVQRNTKRKKPSLCDICGQVFSYVHNLAAHRKSHFKVIKRTKRTATYVCDICGYSTPEKKRLTLHTMSQHENKKAFKCTHPNCSYETWERSSFRCHMYKHSSEKQYQCSYCAYQCIQLKQLRNHLQKQHMVSLPKKYEIGVDNNGKPTVKIVTPREKPLNNKKVKIISVIPEDNLKVATSSYDKQGQDHEHLSDNQTQINEAQVSVNCISAAVHYASQDPYGNASLSQGETGISQDQDLHQHIQERMEAEYQSESQDPNSKSQIIDQEYFQQDQVVSEENGAPYMLLYPSDLGENSYTSVPQAVAEVLVTTNIGEQQMQLHLYPPMSKSSDTHPDNLHLEQVNVATANHVAMTAAQEVSMATNNHNETVGMATQQLHPVTSQVNYVPVINASDVISACSQPLVEDSMQHHPQVAAPGPSGHLVVDSTQQTMNFQNNTVVLSETNTILQSDNFTYATSVIDRGHTFEPPNNTQNIQLSQVPIVTYSELRPPSGDIQEASKNVECIHNSESSSVEQDIARTLIQINDNCL